MSPECKLRNDIYVHKSANLSKFDSVLWTKNVISPNQSINQSIPMIIITIRHIIIHMSSETIPDDQLEAIFGFNN